MIHLITQQKRFFTDLIDTQSSLQDCFEYISKLKYISLDSETSGLCCHTHKLYSIQVGDKHNQWFIDWNVMTKSDILKLKTILESKIIIGQGLKFDMGFLMKQGIYLKRIWDTYLAEFKIYHGDHLIKCNLEAINDRYIGDGSIKKSDRSHIGANMTEAFVVYGAYDIKNLEDIMWLQRKKIKELDIMRAVMLEMAFCIPLSYIEFCGMYLDPVKWQHKINIRKQELVEATKKLVEYVHSNPKLERFASKQMDLWNPDAEKTVLINWSSSPQVTKLFQKLGIKTYAIKKGKKVSSIDAKVLEPQSKEFEIIPLYLALKELEKDISTYGESWIEDINPNTGRVHTTYKQIMNTGRLSSGNKNDKTKNFQNIPNEEEDPKNPNQVFTRRCFTNQYPHTTLVNADYSSMENLLLVNISLEPNLIAFYDLEDADMHCYVASKVFPELAELDFNTIKKEHSDKRSLAKKGGFSLVFGGTGFTVSNNLGIPREVGDAFEEGYFRAFPKLKDFFDFRFNETMKNGYITIDPWTNNKLFVHGIDHIRRLVTKYSFDNKEFWNEYKKEKALDSDRFKTMKESMSNYFKVVGKLKRNSQNYIIQGSSASVTKMAVILFYNYIVKNNLLGKVLISNVVHDRICRG